MQKPKRQYWGVDGTTACVEGGTAWGGEVQSVVGSIACVGGTDSFGGHSLYCGGTACVGEAEPAAVGFRLLFPAVGINNTC